MPEIPGESRRSAAAKRPDSAPNSMDIPADKARNMPIFIKYGIFPALMPLSMSRAINRGMTTSMTTSIVTQRGASIESRLNSLTQLASRFIIHSTSIMLVGYQSVA